MVFQLTSWSLTLDDLWPWMTFQGQINIIKYLVGWIVHVIICICVNNEYIWLPGNYGSDFEQYLNKLLDPISLLANFSHELAQIIPHMTCYQLNKWFWAMFESTLTWPNFSFGQLLTESTHIMTTYDFLSCNGLNNLCWAMFYLILTLYIFTFGQLFTLIGTYNDDI